MRDRVSAEELQHDLTSAKREQRYQTYYRGALSCLNDPYTVGGISLTEYLNGEELAELVQAVEEAISPTKISDRSTNRDRMILIATSDHVVAEIIRTLAKWREPVAHKIAEKEMERGE